MTNEPHTTPPGETVEMPRPTAIPLVLALGIAVLAAGIPLGAFFYVAGATVLLAGLGLWLRELLPGRGHMHESLAEPALRPPPITPVTAAVERLEHGMPGYRLRLPQDVHPTSAGVKGGIVGGLVMPVPAILWGLLSGHGIWYPVNLLAGMVVPGVGGMNDGALEQFHATLLVVGVVIHAVTSLVVGLIYGVLMPTLPTVPRQIAWGGLMMPIAWTAVSFLAMRVVDPSLPALVSWPWFVVSQFVFGITMPAVVLGAKRLSPVQAGMIGGAIGGLAMAVPAVLWAAASGHGFWYPINVLAGMVHSAPGTVTPAELGAFHAEWFFIAAGAHAVLSIVFGVLFALLVPRLPFIPGPVAWGGLVLPLLWTGYSYALMGIANPALQQRVAWPWFIASQFVFGIVAAVVVVRSELVHIPAAGPGPESRQGDTETRRQGDER
jgi:hypothetical protein